VVPESLPASPLPGWAEISASRMAGVGAGAAGPGAVSHLAVAGLHAAARLLLSTGVAAAQARTATLTGQCLRQLRALPGVTVYDLHPAVPRIPVVALNVAGRYPSEVAAALDEGFGVLVRAGMHSAPLMHRSLGTAPHGTVRVSLGPTTVPGDLEVLRDGLAEINARVPVR
jgi:cysteine desulfurase/selenocysteine lyase